MVNYADFKRCAYLFFAYGRARKSDNPEREILRAKLTNFFFPQARSHKQSLSLQSFYKKDGVVYKCARAGYLDLSAQIDVIKNQAGLEIYEVFAKEKLRRHDFELLGFKLALLEKNNIKPRNVFAMHLAGGFFDENNIYESVLIENVSKKLAKFTAQARQDLKKMASTVGARAAGAATARALKKECFKPSLCHSFAACHGAIAQNSILKAFDLNIDQRLMLWHAGLKTLQDLGRAARALTPKQKMQLEFQDKPYVQREKIADFFQNIKGDVYFLDFEAYIPVFYPFAKNGGAKTVAFEYSLHFLSGVKLSHSEYLGEINQENTKEKIARGLCAQIKNDTPVVVFGKSLELEILQDLGRACPPCAAKLENIRQNIYDLGLIFKNGYFYTGAMGNKYSLKAVSRAMLGEIYGAINSGENARLEYRAFLYGTHARKKKARKNLLIYCHTDTLSMALIYQRLREWIS